MIMCPEYHERIVLNWRSYYVRAVHDLLMSPIIRLNGINIHVLPFAWNVRACVCVCDVQWCLDCVLSALSARLCDHVGHVRH